MNTIQEKVSNNFETLVILATEATNLLESLVLYLEKMEAEKKFGKLIRLLPLVMKARARAQRRIQAANQYQERIDKAFGELL